MHILFTRPIDDSKEIILKFKTLGHNVSHMPVIKIQKVEHSPRPGAAAPRGIYLFPLVSNRKLYTAGGLYILPLFVEVRCKRHGSFCRPSPARNLYDIF